MPMRAALNMVYAYLLDGLDPSERKKMNDEIHGWTADNERATNVLHQRLSDAGSDGLTAVAPSVSHAREAD